MTTEVLTEQILRKIEKASTLYYRLILVVAPSGGGKTKAFCAVRDHISALMVNANLELGRRLLELTERQRALRLPRLLREIVYSSGGGLILLDNIEIIFDVNLKQDPLRLLQGLSREKTVVAAWNGAVVEGYLTYAAPDHPEYRRYPMRDFLVVNPEVMT